jgi:glycosyltransferase involved in cell wall biosynthesis
MRQKVFLNGRFLTQPITGVQRTAYELVTALDDLLDKGNVDKEMWSFTLIYSGELINPIKLKHIRLLKRGVLKGNLWEQLELPFYTLGYLLVSMCTVSALLKRKQMVMVHDAAFLVNPASFSLLFRIWYKFAIAILGKVARRIITVSNFSKQELVKHAGFKSEKITVIYNAADHILTYGEPEMDFKSKVLAMQPYCLAVSSLSANKNFKGLSQAIQKIDFKNHNMLIAGGVMSTLRYSEADNSVTYLGYVSNEQLRFLYANAALFIFPSFYEGFGIPPLEAMISGCPVLSTNTSSLPEVLGEACEYCDPANPDDIAAKISGLLNNPDRLRSLQTLGYAQAAKYSWHKSAMSLFSLIKITVQSNS